MLNGVNAAQWRKNGMMEVGEGKMVGDVRKKKKKKKKKKKIIMMIIIVMELRIMEC